MYFSDVLSAPFPKTSCDKKNRSLADGSRYSDWHVLFLSEY